VQKEEQRRTADIDQMDFIQKACDSSSLDRIRELLNATQPGPDESNLRGAEWHFWQRRIHPEENADALPESLLDEFDKYAKLSKTRFSPDARWLFVVSDPGEQGPFSSNRTFRRISFWNLRNRCTRWRSTRFWMRRAIQP